MPLFSLSIHRIAVVSFNFGQGCDIPSVPKSERATPGAVHWETYLPKLRGFARSHIRREVGEKRDGRRIEW